MSYTIALTIRGAELLGSATEAVLTAAAMNQLCDTAGVS